MPLITTHGLCVEKQGEITGALASKIKGTHLEEEAVINHLPQAPRYIVSGKWAPYAAVVGSDDSEPEDLQMMAQVISDQGVDVEVWFKGSMQFFEAGKPVRLDEPGSKG